MAFIIGLIGMICLGKAVFMGWLHKSEWKLLRITDPSRWWKLQIKQALWAAVGIVLILIYGTLSPDKDKSYGSKHPAQTEQTATKNKGKTNKQKTSDKKKSTPSSVLEDETESATTSVSPQQEAEKREEASDGNSSSMEEETSKEVDDNGI